jgi:hypothetical protein
MIMVIHTVEVKPSAHERIVAASLEKQDILNEVKAWRVEYPGKKVKYQTIIEKVERP